MSIPSPPTAKLIPPPPELRQRLALALREVDLLRGLIRLAERAARYNDPPEQAQRDAGCLPSIKEAQHVG